MFSSAVRENHTVQLVALHIIVLTKGKIRVLLLVLENDSAAINVDMISVGSYCFQGRLAKGMTLI